MSWIKLEDVAQISKIKEESNEKPVVIFKHSTSCSISGMAWNRVQRNWKATDSDKITPYYLDLLSYRALSNAIAEEFGVTHASPQVIVVKDGKAVYNNSHMGINYDEIVSLAE
ncbi:bacillithiol system redox-active protein YtxJ [Cyclobacterium amurskyense]|uniref:General stress protein n=1 Tax=Cyclobacterium amurskyense TaxID=320787 RepID=A0A0H4PCQ8_9BACT|nr:bacillithiol system redox-active protein YtxJ [Cyclobacterium amurskyense]AKP50920.1 General stress protein [Cyclobacterium amurskyense]|tara:strand:+ start:17437 stop:17775 length:339 start_codon:yes stop_codon:yes gene_type:complete